MVRVGTACGGKMGKACVLEELIAISIEAEAGRRANTGCKRLGLQLWREYSLEPRIGSEEERMRSRGDKETEWTMMGALLTGGGEERGRGRWTGVA